MDRSDIIHLSVYMECDNVCLLKEDIKMCNHIKSNHYIKKSEIREARYEMEKHGFIKKVIEPGYTQFIYVENSISISPISITKLGLEDYEAIKKQYVDKYIKFKWVSLINPVRFIIDIVSKLHQVFL